MIHFLSEASTLAMSSGISDAVPIVAIVFGVGFLIVKTITRGIVEANARKYEHMKSSNGGKGTTGVVGGSEAAAIRQMQQTLIKMEERVEALETILIEHTRSQKI
jgi:hypothetical protein